MLGREGYKNNLYDLATLSDERNIYIHNQLLFLSIYLLDTEFSNLTFFPPNSRINLLFVFVIINV